MTTLLRTVTLAFASMAAAGSAAAADCDKATRNALLAELDGRWFSELGPPPGQTAIEVEVKGKKLRMWTVWLTDDPNGVAWVKGQRTGPIATLTLAGPGCRQLKGTMYDNHALGVLAEDRAAMRIQFSVEGNARTVEFRKREKPAGL